MSTPAYVHIVDNDMTRRAQIARTLYSNSIHAEIYESLDELAALPPRHGALLISEDVANLSAGSALAEIQNRAGYVPFAVLSSHPSPRRIVSAMTFGALDYLEWPCAPDDLVASVNRVLVVGEAKARAEKLKLDARRAIQNLSPRELEVLRLIVRGYSNKGTAKELGISPRTVEIHRANVMSGLNVGSLADAVRIGIYAGLDQELSQFPGQDSSDTTAMR